MAAAVDVSAIISKGKAKYSIEVSKADDLEYDLGLLSAYDTHPFDLSAFKADAEKTIKDTARDNVQLLVNKLWDLPISVSDEGVFVTIPERKTVLPRSLPLPTRKGETRWEKFAKLKGIQKKKKDKIVFDEETGDWKRRYGYGGINDDRKEWVVEAKPTDEAGTDPWAERKKEKKERLAAQKGREEKNIKHAAKAAGHVLPASLTLAAQIRDDNVDDHSRKRHADSDNDEPAHPKKKLNTPKKDLGRAYDVAKLSTASLGRFDKYVEGETTADRSRGKRHHFESALQETGKERAASLKMLERVLGDEKPTVDTDKAARVFNSSKKGREAAREEAYAEKHTERKKGKKEKKEKKPKKRSNVK